MKLNFTDLVIAKEWLFHGITLFPQFKKMSVFAPGRSDVAYLIELSTCYIKYFLFQVKYTGLWRP